MAVYSMEMCVYEGEKKKGKEEGEEVDGERELTKGGQLEGFVVVNVKKQANRF